MKNTILLLISLMVVITWPLQALERLVDFKEWLGLEATDKIGGITLYEHPTLHDALVKMIGEEKWQSIQHYRGIPAPIEQIDGLMIAMDFNLRSGTDEKEHTIYIDLATQQVIGLCIMEVVGYPVLPDDDKIYNRPAKGLMHHVTYYVATGREEFHRVDIQAYDQSANCNQFSAKKAAQHWQEIISLLQVSDVE